MIKVPLKKTQLKVLMYWACVVAALSCVCGLLYMSGRYILRQGADDPQIQMAEDAAVLLAMGRAVENIVVGPKIDIATSLSPYVVVYNGVGVPTFSSGLLSGAMPTLPKGVFAIAENNKKIKIPAGLESRFTWQPTQGARQALVLVQTNTPSGVRYVAVGRSLREIERREGALLWLVLYGWASTLLILLSVHVLVRKFVA